jgi:hypothetical protein
METMAKKRKVKKFGKVTAVKALARERIGAPPTERVLPHRKRDQPEMHKPTLTNLIDDPSN